MSSVDMTLLKELRAATNAPLKDCKQALEESANDFDTAQEWLKQKGILKAASKADRATKEGVVLTKEYGDKIVGIKLACETDFVARNDMFHTLAYQLLDMASVSGPVTTFSDVDEQLQQTLKAKLQENFVAIGENMQIADLFVQIGQHIVYTHPGNKLVAVVFYTGDAQKAKAAAMQIAAMNPTYLSVEDVPASVREEVTVRFSAEVANSGKPADIVEKIVAGKVAKERQEYVLLEQVSILDETKKVKELLGSDTHISSFIRCQIG